MGINKLTFDTDKKTVVLGGITPVFNSFIGFTGASISGAPSGNPILGTEFPTFSQEGSLLISVDGGTGITALNEVRYSKATNSLIFEGYSLEITGEAGASAYIGGHTFELPTRYRSDNSNDYSEATSPVNPYGNHDCGQPIQLRPGKFQHLNTYRGIGCQTGALILNSSLYGFGEDLPDPLPSGFGRWWNVGYFPGKDRSFTESNYPTQIGLNYISVLSYVILPTGQAQILYGGTGEFAIGCNSNLTGGFSPAAPLQAQRFTITEPIQGLESTNFNYSGTGEGGYGFNATGGGSGGTAGRTGEGYSGGSLFAGFSGSSFNSATPLQFKTSITTKPGKRNTYSPADYHNSLMMQGMESSPFDDDHLGDQQYLVSDIWTDHQPSEGGFGAYGFHSTTGGVGFTGPSTGPGGLIPSGVSGASVDGLFVGQNYAGLMQGTLRSSIGYGSLTLDFNFNDTHGMAFGGESLGISGVNNAQSSVNNILPSVASMFTNRDVKNYCKNGGYLWTWFDFQSYAYFVDVDGVQCPAYSLLYFPLHNFTNTDEPHFGGVVDKRAFSGSQNKLFGNSKFVILTMPGSMASFNSENSTAMYSWHYDMTKMVDYSQGYTSDMDTEKRYRDGTLLAEGENGEGITAIGPYDVLSGEHHRASHGAKLPDMSSYGNLSGKGFPWPSEDLTSVVGETTPIFLVKFDEADET